MVATRQYSDGKRASLPKFTPFLVSDFGEMSPAAVELQEWIVEQFRVRLKKQGRRDDGCSSSELVRQFRHKFKVGIQLGIASGLGAMIQAGGQHWGNLLKCVCVRVCSLTGTSSCVSLFVNKLLLMQKKQKCTQVAQTQGGNT